MEQLEDFKAQKQEYLATVLEALKTPLPDQPEPLWQALKVVEGYCGYLQFLLARADAYLDTAERRELEKVIRENTEKMPAYEKEVHVKARVVDEREFRDYIKGLLDSAKQKVMLGQSRMAYCRDVYGKGE